MFPSIVAENRLQPSYFGGRRDIPVLTRTSVNDDNEYHLEKYQQRVRAVMSGVQDDMHNQKKYATGYFRSLVASNGNALGSGNKMLFENTGYKDGQFTGGVLHTPAGIKYAQNLLQRRAQEFEAIAEMRAGMEPSQPVPPQPVPLTKEQGMKLEVGMFLDEISSSIASGTTFEGRIDDFKRGFTLLVRVGMEFTLDELNEVKEKVETIYNDLTATEGDAPNPSKRKAIIEVVDVMYEFIDELIATFNLPQNERAKRIQDYVQRIGRTMIKDTGKNRPSKNKLKQDVSKADPDGTPDDPELDTGITRLKELKKDPTEYVQKRGERVERDAEITRKLNEEASMRRKEADDRTRRLEELEMIKLEEISTKKDLIDDIKKMHRQLDMNNPRGLDKKSLSQLQKSKAYAENMIKKNEQIDDINDAFKILGQTPPRLKSKTPKHVQDEYDTLRRTLRDSVTTLQQQVIERGLRMSSTVKRQNWEKSSLETLARKITQFQKLLETKK